MCAFLINGFVKNMLQSESFFCTKITISKNKITEKKCMHFTFDYLQKTNILIF
jgi:hypothetical protein